MFSPHLTLSSANAHPVQGCDRPDHGTKFYYINEGKETGGRDWSAIVGQVLCKACYNRFSKGGTIQKRIQTAPKSAPESKVPPDSQRCENLDCANNGSLRLGKTLCQACLTKYAEDTAISPPAGGSRPRLTNNKKKHSGRDLTDSKDARGTEQSEASWRSVLRSTRRSSQDESPPLASNQRKNRLARLAKVPSAHCPVKEEDHQVRTGNERSLPGFARESVGISAGAEVPSGPSRPKKRRRKELASESARKPNVEGKLHDAGAESSSSSSGSPSALEILTEVATSVGRKIGIVLQLFA
jgi:hypothetical protein